ncbi:GGDEF domain-containing protein [Actinopolyspora halophila]|uniref:GGDEF domain-containing protein n=1 Tax=Actinopolyspora halophila TaxID=1850 RepID=UPI00037DE967|nr:GGDEF domain-containing protein [Actinopolyspora halophila]
MPGFSTQRLLGPAALTGWLATTAWLCRTLRQLHQARRDDLTGLLTRAAWYSRARRRLGPTAALGLLDVDGLKPVNDRHGHAAGDEVLRTIAARLTTALGSGALLGRLGGDELVFLMDTTPSQRHLDVLVAELTRPIRLADQDTTVRVGIALGVAPAARRSEQHRACGLSAALRTADTAMYRAKKHPERTWLWTTEAASPRSS